MAKEVAIGKRAKISEAQQYMILAVGAASIALGVAISLTVHFVQQIIFNAKVIAAEEQSITSYSDIIKKIGVCKSPKGNVYTDEEIKQCDPASISTSDIPGTLRADILENLAANQALNSVPKEDDSSCINPSTSKKYTYEELSKRYNDAKGEQAQAEASYLIKTCSALRIVPDALPAFKNEEALLASLNKLFIISNFEPETISPSNSASSESEESSIGQMAVSLSMDETSTETIMMLLNNIEHSIRNFNFERASIEWGKNDTIEFNAQANAYYMTPSKIVETETTMKAEDSKK